MNHTDLSILLDYHYWARDRVLAAVEPLTAEQFLRPLGNSFSSVRDTLSHIVGAEEIWLSRWKGVSPTSLPVPDRFADLAAVRAHWLELEQEVRGFLEKQGEAGAARVHNFKLLSGAEMSAPFWQMLQHVVNHATYHRGQVTTLLRQMGAKPPAAMDMIYFYRERQSRSAAG